MPRRLTLVPWLTIVWVALWGDLSWANVVAGALLGTAVVAAVQLPLPVRSRRIAVWAALVYAAVFARDLVVASVQVARQVFWPVGRLRPAVLAVPMRSSDPGLLALVADTITLTPGTLTIEADAERPMLWMHVLHLAPGEEPVIVEHTQELERLAARVLRVPLDATAPAAHPEVSR